MSHNLETSVILSLGKCTLIVTRPHLSHSSPIVRTFIRCFFLFSIGSFYITWNCFWMTAYNTSNNFLQISCCEFEYFSINKRYTSRRQQRNETNKSQNELAWIYSAFMKISTSTTEYVPLRSVLRGSICHFPSNLLRQLHVVQPPSSDSCFHMRNSIWFREFELDYGYLINVFVRKLAEEK